MYYIVEFAEGSVEIYEDMKPTWQGLFKTLDGILSIIPHWVQQWVNSAAHQEIKWNTFNPSHVPIVDITYETLEKALDTEDGTIFKFGFGWKWAPALMVTIKSIEVLDKAPAE
jgi:hypothetical protein